MSTQFSAGIGRAVITPKVGLPLVGYFNPRPNTGKLDDLFAKAVVFQNGESLLAIVSCDLCFLEPEIADGARQHLVKMGLGDWAKHLLLMATHTHTGPYPAEFFGAPADEEYLEFLEKKIAEAVQAAVADLAPATLETAQSFGNPYAFNRRYWMKNGTVVTNPGKLNPNIVRPEGPVDDEIGMLVVRQNGAVAAVLANIVNHTDTMGGNLVSADWPGFMERKLQKVWGGDFSVLSVIGCSGNINHFDVSSDFDQTNPDEARRIGEGYADILNAMKSTLKPLTFDKMTVKRSFVTVDYAIITDAMKKAAEETMERTKDISSDGDLTSEELASGDGAVARFFAWQTLEFAKYCSGKSRDFEHYAVQFDNEFAIASLPGECFTQIGQAIKAGSPAKQTFVSTLSMGECGYVCMQGCHERGGYEPLPVKGGGPAPASAQRLVKAALELLWR